MQLIWEDQEESFCICFLGLFARIARLSQVQTFPHISVVQEISILIKIRKGGGGVSKAKYFTGKYEAKLKLSQTKNRYGYFLGQTLTVNLHFIVQYQTSG